MNELPRVLFSQVALMELVGFNAQQVEEGLTKRGDARRTTKKKQGPLSPQSLADNISKLSREQMETLFNRSMRDAGWCPSWSRHSAIWGHEDASARLSSIAGIWMGWWALRD